MGARFRWIRPAHGEVRTVTRFLLFPRCLGNEWRWWGRETIVQKFYDSSWSFWYDVEWAE